MKYVITNGFLLDGTKDMKPQKNRMLFIRGEWIERITDDSPIPADYTVIDAHGMYVLPSLINMHVHLAGNGKPQKNSVTMQNLSGCCSPTRSVSEPHSTWWNDMPGSR